MAIDYSASFAQIGLAPGWIGGLARHPAELRELLVKWRRLSSRYFHTDTSASALTTIAGKINHAFDTLEGLSDDELMAAALAYTESTPLSYEEVETMLAEKLPEPSMPIRGSHQIASLEEEIRHLEERSDQSTAHLYRFLDNLIQRPDHEEPQDGIGRQLRLSQLRGNIFFSPMRAEYNYNKLKPDELPTYLDRAECDLGWIDEEDQLWTGLFRRHTPMKSLDATVVTNWGRQELRQHLAKFAKKPRFAESKMAGRVLGFAGKNLALRYNKGITPESPWRLSWTDLLASDIVAELSEGISPVSVFRTPEERLQPGLLARPTLLVSLKHGDLARPYHRLSRTIFPIEGIWWGSELS